MLNCIWAPMDTLVRAILLLGEFIRSGTITSNVKWIHNDEKSKITVYKKNTWYRIKTPSMQWNNIWAFAYTNDIPMKEHGTRDLWAGECS